MPSSGDTIRLSIASPATPGIDLTITGPNTTWDFSQLQWTSQTVDTFFSVSSTGVFAFIFFTSSFATKGPDIAAIPGFQVTGVYNFFGKTSTLYQQNAIGAYLNAIPAPINYTPKDVIYRFPLNFTDQDTSNSAYGISLPNLGSYNATQTRINNVDGWGTVITPFGSFNSLRMKSELTGRDSLYIDSLSTGFAFDRPLTREYKWLATGMKVPVLQINTQELGPGNETITSILYRDSVRFLPVGVEEQNILSLATIYPNPAIDKLTISIPLAKSVKLHYELISNSGQLIYMDEENTEAGLITKEINITDYPSGIYMLRITTESGTYNKQVIINRK